MCPSLTSNSPDPEPCSSFSFTSSPRLSLPEGVAVLIGYLNMKCNHIHTSCFRCEHWYAPVAKPQWFGWSDEELLAATGVVYVKLRIDILTERRTNNVSESFSLLIHQFIKRFTNLLHWRWPLSISHMVCWSDQLKRVRPISCQVFLESTCSFTYSVKGIFPDGCVCHTVWHVRFIQAKEHQILQVTILFFRSKS